MPVNIHTLPEYSDEKTSLLQLTDNFHDEGELIVKGSRNIIKSNTFQGQQVNIKYFKKPGAFNAVVYNFFRESKAKRSFDYAVRLLKAGIRTPKPIAYIEEKTAFTLQSSYYICAQINYDFTFRELIHDPLWKDRDLILEQFTEFTFRMHENRINFLDHSPGNTLIVKRGEGQYDFYLIDLNRMTFEDLSMAQRMDNFKKLWLSKTMVKIIARKYAVLSGEDPEQLQRILLEKTIAFKRRITKKKWLKRKLKK